MEEVVLTLPGVVLAEAVGLAAWATEVGEKTGCSLTVFLLPAKGALRVSTEVVTLFHQRAVSCNRVG